MASDAESILHEDADLRARALGPVAVMVWHGAPKRSTIDAFTPKVVAHHQANKDGVALVVAAHGGPPNDEARKAFREMVRSVERSVAGVAVLIGLPGLRGAVVRGAVNTAVKALRLPFEVKVFETPREIGLHVEKLLRARRIEGPPAGAIERVLAELDVPLASAQNGAARPG